MDLVITSERRKPPTEQNTEAHSDLKLKNSSGNYHQIKDLHISEDWQKVPFTAKSFSEALILASTNPQYDKKIVHWITNWVHENSNLRTFSVQKFCFVFVLTFKTMHVHNMSELVVLMHWSGKSINNLFVILWVSWCKNKSS